MHLRNFLILFAPVYFLFLCRYNLGGKPVSAAFWRFWCHWADDMCTDWSHVYLDLIPFFILVSVKVTIQLPQLIWLQSLQCYPKWPNKFKVKYCGLCPESSIRALRVPTQYGRLEVSFLLWRGIWALRRANPDYLTTKFLSFFKFFIREVDLLLILLNFNQVSYGLCVSCVSLKLICCVGFPSVSMLPCEYYCFVLAVCWKLKVGIYHLVSFLVSSSDSRFIES